jgi:hypothetical protein
MILSHGCHATHASNRIDGDVGNLDVKIDRGRKTKDLQLKCRESYYS